MDSLSIGLLSGSLYLPRQEPHIDSGKQQSYLRFEIRSIRPTTLMDQIERIGLSAQK